MVAQLLMDLTSYKITPAHILVGFVTAGALLSAFGFYQPLVNWAGAGATVPLSGNFTCLCKGRNPYSESILFTLLFSKSGRHGIFNSHLSASRRQQ